MAMGSDMVTDKTGREIKAGDILKVYPYRDGGRGRRYCYMYKLVFEANDKGRLEHGGPHLYGVDILCIHKSGIVDARKYLLRGHQEGAEIIDGHAEDMPNAGIKLWYEREKHEV